MEVLWKEGNAKGIRYGILLRVPAVLDVKLLALLLRVSVKKKGFILFKDRPAQPIILVVKATAPTCSVH